MTGKLLSVDPGGHTGFALIEFGPTFERVLEFGVLRRNAPDFHLQLVELMERADWLVVESGQFVKANPQAALSIAQAKGEIIGMWPDGRTNLIELEASKWQARLKLRGKRKQRKRGSFIYAQAALDLHTQGGPLTQDSADAICMGLAAARMLKAEELLDRRASNA